MDEFTSSLDENTELKIIENLRTISKNKTIIFITHRKIHLIFVMRFMN